MSYDSEDYYDRENKILKESEYSKKKHLEAEERYKNLVDKKPLSVDLKESLAILNEIYAKNEGKNGFREKNFFDFESPEINEIDFEQDEEKHEADDNQNNCVERESAADENNILNSEITENTSEIEAFKRFYNENIVPVLEKPEFKDIKDFFDKNDDFSNEKYESLMKLFKEKTGISYSEIQSNTSYSDINGIDEKTLSEVGIEADFNLVEDDTEKKENELDFDDFKEGAKRVHVVPIEHNKDEKDDAMGGFLVAGALSGIVILVAIFFINSFW